MNGIFKGKRAQSTAEYAILFGLVVAVAIGMQTYVKRSLQGGIKFAVDKVQKGDTGTGQYEPYYLESSYDTAVGTSKDTEDTSLGGGVTRGFGAKTITRSGYQKIRDTTGGD